ncbi:MAG: hypothetical protein ABFD64_06185 [Armatimonadota bacterium]
MPGVILAIVILAGLFIYYQIKAKINPDWKEKLENGRICTWCGKPVEDYQKSLPSDSSLRLPGRNLRSHIDCEERALAAHRRYYYYFLGIAIISAVCMILGTLSDFSHSGKLDWDMLEIAILPFSLPLMILLAVKGWEKRLSEKKEKYE